jgi:hypothetical protein
MAPSGQGHNVPNRVGDLRWTGSDDFAVTSKEIQEM